MENEYSLAGDSQFQLLLGLRTQVSENRYCGRTSHYDAGQFARFHLPGLADGIGPLQVLGHDCSLDWGKAATALRFPPVRPWMMRAIYEEKVHSHGTGNQSN